MEVGRFNTELKLFEEPFRGFNYPKIKFLRWLAVNDLLEHPVQGRASGDLIPAMVSRYGRETFNPKSKTEAERERFLRMGGYGPLD